jgi:hypothetical protein
MMGGFSGTGHRVAQFKQKQSPAARRLKEAQLFTPLRQICVNQRNLRINVFS